MPARVTVERVSKEFTIGRSPTVKDLLLGSRGHRYRRRRVSVLKDVSFELGEGESLSILGRNGSGKSTCLKIVAGTIRPSSGSVSCTGRVAPLLELGAGFHPDLTGRENVFLNGSILGLSRAAINRVMSDILDFASIGDQIDTPVRFYSSGMYARLGFSVAVFTGADIIIVDETLAVGDASFQEKCLERVRDLRKQGVSFIVVTHSVELARSFTDRALVLDSGKVVFQGLPEFAGQHMGNPIGESLQA